MTLQEQLNQDLISAMKAKDADKVSTLRIAKAALTHLSIEKKKDTLNDEEVLAVLQKQLKQRKESIESFEKGGRTELAQKEKAEASILEIYLPKQLADSELSSIIKQTIEKTGSKTKADSGRLMKELMPLVKGKADGKRVSDIVNQLLP